MTHRRVLQSIAAPATLTLHPGDVAVATTDQTLDTLLGSCVAVLLSDPRGTIAAMCHVVHAEGGARGDTRFTRQAIEAMGAALRARGFEPRLCEAHVFGGGNMFPERFRAVHVGDTNVEAVLAELRRTGIAVAGHDVGGPFYRRVTWTLGAGHPTVWRTPLEQPAGTPPAMGAALRAGLA